MRGARFTSFRDVAAHALGTEWLTWLAVVAAIVPSIGFDTLQPLVFRAIIDLAIVPRDAVRLAQLVGLLAGLIVVRLLGEIGREYFAARAGSRVVARLRLQVFDHLQQLGQDFFARTQLGALTFRYTTDLATIEAALTHDLPRGFRDTLALVACGVLLFTIEWRLALASVLLVSAVSLAPRVLGPAAQRASERVQQDSADLAAIVGEVFSAQPVVKAFGIEGLTRTRVRKKLEVLARSNVRFGLYSGLTSATIGVGGTSLSVLAIGAGAYLVMRGELSLGTLFAYTELLWYVAESIQGLSSILRPLRLAAGASERLLSLLNEPPAVADAPDARELPVLASAIEFRDVSFEYVNGQRTLDGACFRILKGASIAVVGASGSGKSTILNLLLRFYEPSSGSVAFDGLDIRHVLQASLRAQMGVVLQDSLLFNSTVRENIRLGKPSATDAEVEVAARAAEIHQTILELADGYDTVVGERGGRLSGGQRQRVAIARALLRDPTILLLDEATSALDPATEEAINLMLRRVARGRTVVTVTHRLSTVAASDWIVVLDRGRVLEQGVHAELVRQQGAYTRLWARQQGVSLTPDGAQGTVEPEWLRQVPLFEHISSALLGDLAGRFATERVAEQQIVVRQGEPADRFYVVARGKLAVTQLSPDRQDTTLRVLTDGDHFGEIALLRRVNRTATVRAVVPSVLLSLSREEFAELLRAAPSLVNVLEAAMHDGRDGRDMDGIFGAFT